MQISSAAQMDDGLLPNMRPGTVWIDLSTNDLDTADAGGSGCRTRITLIARRFRAVPRSRRRHAERVCRRSRAGGHRSDAGLQGDRRQRRPSRPTRRRSTSPNCPGHALLHPDHHVRRSTDARRQGGVDLAKMTELIQKSTVAAMSPTSTVPRSSPAPTTSRSRSPSPPRTCDWRWRWRPPWTPTCPSWPAPQSATQPLRHTMDQLRHICWPPR